MGSSKNKEKITSALTKSEIVSQLEHLGLRDFMCVEVHGSLEKIGYVVGGATTVNDALKQVLSRGTIVMPSYSTYNSEPLYWKDPPIDLRLADKVRSGSPGYDIYSSDIAEMGDLAINLRNRKDTYHSYHPNKAFMAAGLHAKDLMSSQPLSFPLGKGSPLDKMYRLPDSYVLLIGVNYDKAEAFHLAEALSGVRAVCLQGGAVKKSGENLWKKYLDIEMDDSEFIEFGKHME